MARPLKLTKFDDPAVLNRWADDINKDLTNTRLALRKLTAPNTVASGATVAPAQISSGSAITLQTNSVNNVTQNLLNLIAGTGISLVSNNLGSVTFNVTADTDFYQTVQQAGTSKTQRSKLNFLAPTTVTDNAGSNSSDVAVPVFVASGGSHAIGLVPDPGAVAGSTKFLREDATFAVPPGSSGVIWQVYSSKNLASSVAVTGSTITTIDSLAVTMPASGGPWRALVHYYYAINGGIHHLTWVSDGTNSFAADQGTSNNNNDGASACENSTVTYSNNAVITFTAKIINTGNCTVVTSPSGEGSGFTGTGLVSSLTVSIASSV